MKNRRLDWKQSIISLINRLTDGFDNKGWLVKVIDLAARETKQSHGIGQFKCKNIEKISLKHFQCLLQQLVTLYRHRGLTLLANGSGPLFSVASGTKHSTHNRNFFRNCKFSSINFIIYYSYTLVWPVSFGCILGLCCVKTDKCKFFSLFFLFSITLYKIN